MNNTYQVEVSAKYPAWNEVASIIEIKAATAKEALSKARKEVARWDLLKQDGPTIYKILKGETNECN